MDWMSWAVGQLAGQRPPTLPRVTFESAECEGSSHLREARATEKTPTRSPPELCSEGIPLLTLCGGPVDSDCTATAPRDT